MRLDQFPVDRSGEQLVDVLVPRGLVRSEQVQILSVANARHDLDSEQVREAEDGRALAMCVGVHRMGLQDRMVLGDEVQDAVTLLGPAGDEPREQRDVGVRHQVVANPAITAICLPWARTFLAA